MTSFSSPKMYLHSDLSHILDYVLSCHRLMSKLGSCYILIKSVVKKWNGQWHSGQCSRFQHQRTRVQMQSKGKNEMGHSWSLFRFFSLFEQTNIILQQINVKIVHWVSGAEVLVLEHESSPITTRPWLQFYRRNVLLLLTVKKTKISKKEAAYGSFKLEEKNAQVVH